MNDLPQRKHPRLKAYDYTHGWYFVTLCTAGRKHILGTVRSPRPTSLPTIIRSFKTMVTRQLGVSIWQTSYYEHVIRNEGDYLRVRQYMEDNPARWAEDDYYQPE